MITLPTTNAERRTVANRLLLESVLGTPQQVAALVHPDAVNRESVAEPPGARVRGPEGFAATGAWLRSAYSDIAFGVEHVLVEGDVLVTHGTMSGRHTGDFVVYDEAGEVMRAFAPTGRSFKVTHTHWLRLADGLIIEHWANRDDQGQSIQLGWVPPSPGYLWRCARATRRARRAAAPR